MAGTQTMRVTLQRDSLQTPWGFRLQGGADFRMPFTINKITAGSPADGVLHRGDVILEIDQRPVSSLLHTDALELIQRAGGQVIFLIQRGSTPLPSYTQHQRPFSAMPWSLANAASYLEKTLYPAWSPPAASANPSACYRSRALERIPDPKPLLSQTGSPLMPGPVPSVSTKTRGYTKPPVFHTEPTHLFNTAPIDASYSSAQYSNSSATYNPHHQTMPSTSHHHPHDTSSYQPAWKTSLNDDSNIYVPSYQKKVPVNQTVQRPISNEQTHQHYTKIQRQQQQQHYRPASVQPINLVHRQFNSPMPLYSRDNVEQVMKSHASHISHINIVPSVPKQSHENYSVVVSPVKTTTNAPICYVTTKQNLYASDF